MRADAPAVAARLAMTVAGLPLKNPVMAGSGEATMTLAGITAAVDAGAAAVVAKSTNGSDAAKRQLAGAEYALLDERWEPLDFDVSDPHASGLAPRSASLFCRSGLVAMGFDAWIDTLLRADAHAQRHGSYIVASLIVDDIAGTVRMARAIQDAGLRWLELNLGAPHAGEALPGTIEGASDAATAEAFVRPIREAVSIPVTVKIGSSGDPLAAAAGAFGAGADAVCLAGRFPAFLPDPATRRPVLGTFGAIGGAWALPVSLHRIAKARARFGPDACLIGTNGARGGLDVARFLLAGASAVQMTTAVVTDGPAALTRTLEELSDYLAAQGVSASQIVGEATDHVRTYQDVSR
jgi:dihydroorotate dehydrogenase (NAD+) catalytic subunit